MGSLRKRILAWFGRSGPATQTLTRQTIERQLKQVLEKQFEDGREKQQNSHYWGDTGRTVLRAAKASQALLQWQEGETVQQFFDRVIPAMADLANEYRYDDIGDPDGYGVGTIREIERALMVKARCCGCID